MKIIGSKNINADTNGKWKWNFNPQTPGTYRIEVIPKTADGNQSLPYYKDIIITQAEIDALIESKRKKYYKILNYDTPDYSSGQISEITFQELPHEIMYLEEQDTRHVTIKFNQSYWYADGGESTIHVLLVETESPTNIISNISYTTENEHGNYSDPADSGYDATEVSIVKNVEIDPKLLNQYHSVTLKIMRESSNGITSDIYANDIPLLDYDGNLDDDTELNLISSTIGTHPDSNDAYRIMNYDDVIYVGHRFEDMIITSASGNALNFKSMKMFFIINYTEYESDGVTIKNTNSIKLYDNIIDVGIDPNKAGYIFNQLTRLPYLYDFLDGEINIIYEATLDDDSIIDVATLKYAYN